MHMNENPAKELKDQGNAFFRKGMIQDAIQCYTAALKSIHEKNFAAPTNDILLLSPTLLSNRAMCHLKVAESTSSSSSSSTTAVIQQALLHCIEDCTMALKELEKWNSYCNASKALESETGKEGTKTNHHLQMRSKILYRRARALVMLGNRWNCVIEESCETSSSSSSSKGSIHDLDIEAKNLNAAAKDILQLLSFEPNNAEAVSLLRSIRAKYAACGGIEGEIGNESQGFERSPISKSLAYLRSCLFIDDSSQGEAVSTRSSMSKQCEGGEDIGTILSCLRTIQALLAEDLSSSAMEVGRRGGVPILMQVARRGIIMNVASSSRKQTQPEQASINEQCRIASLHILSVCCSYDPFAITYFDADGGNCLSTRTLTQIIVEDKVEDLWNQSGVGSSSANVVVAAMTVLVRLILHLNHMEVERAFAPRISQDGTIAEIASSSDKNEGVEVDAASVCQAAVAAFLWKAPSSANNSDVNPSRAALDLLSAWTASDDLDAVLDENSLASSFHSKGDGRRRYCISVEEMRAMKPRQAAAYRKREADYRRKNIHRAKCRISRFCGDAIPGGLDTMLTSAVTTDDPRLRRDIGLQIGRWMSVVIDDNNGNDDEVKKLVYKSLGCSDWNIVPDGTKNDREQVSSFSTPTIEELNDDGEEKGEVEIDATNTANLLIMMKRGQLAASLLLGNLSVGTWALKYGWSDGNGIFELKCLISSGNSRAMSIASELVSAASSVESARPLLAALVEDGTLEDLLTHTDADVRSGAASCAAKLGLASKALSTDEREVTGLLDVAIELLYDDGKCNGTETQLLPKLSALSTKEYTTSIERGVEILTYLVSKTSVKEMVASGYSPPGSPGNRKLTLERLVEIALSPNSANAHIAFGLAGIFNLLAVSIDTLRNEAFLGKDITKEQYDQLQAMGKTVEERESEAKQGDKDRDDQVSVMTRIKKLASANVPSAMVKLLESSSSETTHEKLLEGMGRMASEPSVRGIMIQQGCLTSCLRLSKGDDPTEKEKILLRRARSCVAKLLVTTNPATLTVSQRSGAVGPLLKLVKDSDALDLQHFEALMSLTNLAGFDDETKNGVVVQGGIPILGYAMFSDHEMVRQAATEAMCNMVPHHKFMEYLMKEENMHIWVAFSLDYESNFACARAAMGCLAMAALDPDVAKTIILDKKFNELIRTLLECGQLELMHRVLALIAGLLEHGGDCRKAIMATGAGPFCDAYLTSYSDENKTMEDFKFRTVDRDSLAATLNLAKTVVRLLR